MKVFKPISALVVGFSAVALSVPAFATTESARVVASKDDSVLDQCIAKQRKLSALFLIDESKSLEKTDPDGDRVPALRAAARAIYSLTRGDENSSIDIEVGVAGFAADFVLHKDWMTLNDESLEEVLEEIDKSKDAERHSAVLTRYHVGLQGAYDTFVEGKNDGTNCRLLIWFSDGTHNDDGVTNKYNNDKSPLSSKEQKQITSTICGKDGIADQLRTAGVFVEAIGLNENEKDMELMKLIAENQGTFVSGDFSIGEGDCGVAAPVGKFANAKNSSEIVDVLTAVPGSPRDKVNAIECADNSEPDCAEIVFFADDSVVGFKAQITKPEDGIDSVVLTPGGGAPIQLFPIDGGAANIDIEELTENKVLIDARKTAKESLSGEWSIRFLGARASEASSRVKFIGDAKIELVDTSGKAIKSVDRFKTEPLEVKIDAASGGSLIGKVETSVRGIKKVAPLGNESKEVGTFAVGASSLQQLLQSVDFSDASALEILVQPVGYVKGLKQDDGTPVDIEYKPFSQEVSVKNGSKFPQFIPADKGEPAVAIKGTRSATVSARFMGPDSGDGAVEWISVDENDQEFKIVSGDKCEIPQQTEKVCSITVAPGIDGYGSVLVPLKAKLSSKTSEETAEQIVPLDVVLSRDPNVGKGISKAILLLLLFIVVQIVIRGFFALLISRFAALEPIYRKIKLPIKITADGSVSGANGGQLVANEEEATFLFEATDSQTSFQLFDYSFAASPLRSFMKSTTAPRGFVTKEGSQVFASSGQYLSGKAKKGELTSSGQVELSLRDQWVISIPNSELVAFENGSNEVNGELLIILAPLQRSSLEEQLSELEFAITSSTFSTDLASFREKFASPVNESEDASDEPNNPVSAGEADVFNDPFTSSPSVYNETQVVAEEKVSRKERKRRAKQDATDTSGSSGASSAQDPDPFDPFA